MEQDRLLKKIYEAREIGKGKRGRPNKTWKEEVKSAAEKEKFPKTEDCGKKYRKRKSNNMSKSSSK